MLTRRQAAGAAGRPRAASSSTSPGATSTATAAAPTGGPRGGKPVEDAPGGPPPAPGGGPHPPPLLEHASDDSLAWSDRGGLQILPPESVRRARNEPGPARFGDEQHGAVGSEQT